MTETAHTHMTGTRAGRKPTPHATFRRWSMDGTSYNVLIPFLEQRDYDRAKALLEAKAANARALGLKAN